MRTGVYQINIVDICLVSKACSCVVERRSDEGVYTTVVLHNLLQGSSHSGLVDSGIPANRVLCPGRLWDNPGISRLGDWFGAAKPLAGAGPQHGADR
jgi:hypothetical protein